MNDSCTLTNNELYIPPSKMRISTITALYHIPSGVDLNAFFCIIPMVEPGSMDGFVFLKHFVKEPLSPEPSSELMPRIVCCTKDVSGVKYRFVKTYFQNQLTFKFQHFDSSIQAFRTVSGFLFRTGCIKLAGLKSHACVETIGTKLKQVFRRLAFLREIADETLFEHRQLLFHTNQVLFDNVTICERQVDNHPLILLPPPSASSSETDSILSVLFDSVCRKESCAEDVELFGDGCQPVMYNVDFKLNFKIIPKQVFRLIVTKYGLSNTEYDPERYPGVNIRYWWNDDHDTTSSHSESTPGVCRCSVRCTGKGKGKGKGNGFCKIITISVFQSGNVMITGANAFHQVEKAYTFVNSFFKDNFAEVVYMPVVV